MEKIKQNKILNFIFDYGLWIFCIAIWVFNIVWYLVNPRTVSSWVFILTQLNLILLALLTIIQNKTYKGK